MEFFRVELQSVTLDAAAESAESGQYQAVRWSVLGRRPWYVISESLLTLLIVN